jgi:hypothetical protein
MRRWRKRKDNAKSAMGAKFSQRKLWRMPCAPGVFVCLSLKLLQLLDAAFDNLDVGFDLVGGKISCAECVG